MLEVAVDIEWAVPCQQAPEIVRVPYLLYSPPLDMSENLNACSSPLGPCLSDSMSSALPHLEWLPKSSLYVSYHLWEDGTKRRTAGKGEQDGKE